MMKRLFAAPLFILIMLMMLVLAVLSLLMPDKTMSQLENRPLAAIPELSLQHIATGRWMDQAEDYVDDQLPLRDTFIQINLFKERVLQKTESNGVVRGKSDRLYGDSRQFNPAEVKKAVSAIGQFAHRQGLPFTFIMVPPSSVMYQEMLPAFYPLADPLAMIEQEVQRYPEIDYLPVKNALLLESQSQMTHYRTDHHLTAAGAKTVYEELVKHLGLKARADDAILIEQDGFTGSYYARAPYPFMRADTLTFFDVKDITLEIEGEQKPGLVDTALLDSPNKYHALLYNNPGLLTLSSQSGERGSALVIKDSNANVILPLLARHYQRLHAVDFRYLKLGFDLDGYIKKEGIEEVLCIYGTDVFLTDRNLLLHLAPSKN